MLRQIDGPIGSDGGKSKAFLILDEAHIYDGAPVTHCLLHRLQQKRKELMPQFEPLRVHQT